MPFLVLSFSDERTTSSNITQEYYMYAILRFSFNLNNTKTRPHLYMYRFISFKPLTFLLLIFSKFKTCHTINVFSRHSYVHYRTKTLMPPSWRIHSDTMLRKIWTMLRTIRQPPPWWGTQAIFGCKGSMKFAKTIPLVVRFFLNIHIN